MTNTVPLTPASGHGLLRSPPPHHTHTAEPGCGFPSSPDGLHPPCPQPGPVLRQSDPGLPLQALLPPDHSHFVDTEHPPFWAFCSSQRCPWHALLRSHPHLLNSHHPSRPSARPRFLGKLPRAKRMSPSRVLSQPLVRVCSAPSPCVHLLLS